MCVISGCFEQLDDPIFKKREAGEMPRVDRIKEYLWWSVLMGSFVSSIAWLDTFASNDGPAIPSFFFLNLLPEWAAFDKIFVDTCVVPDSAAACFDAVGSY